MARGKASTASNGSKKAPKGLKKSGKVSNLVNYDSSGMVETVKCLKEKSSSLSSRRLAHTRKKYQKSETQENITNGNKNDLTETILNENNHLNLEKRKVQKHESSSATKVRKSPQLVGKRKILRSSSKGSPGTRLRSNKISTKILSKGENNSMENSTKSKKERRKKHNKKKHVPQDELSRIKKRVRYFLNRIGFEQSMIDAYSSEGWKGQSQEKIRPEKELQKAATKILQCKVAIREAFHELHSLCLQGSLEESAFDSEGQVNSEDIFCAKCGSKELFVDNDIILCDGACDRGFHQNCVEPPLATEDIPGDEGWLCPGCDSKLDCVDLVNDHLGTAFELEDSWENFFSEAAATADGNEKPLDLEDMPSDDTEDDDYDPDAPDLLDGTKQEDGSGSAESDSSSDSGSDGEDSESDEGSESNGGSEAPLGGHSDYASQYMVYSGKEKSNMAKDKKAWESSDLPAISDPDMNDNIDLPVSGKRHRDQVDYKKLHDEVYGPDDDKSMSEDDEEWGPGNQSRKGKESDMEHDDSNASEGKQLKKVSVAKRKAKLLDVKPPEDINFSKSSSSKKVKVEKENGKCTVVKKDKHHEGSDHKDAVSLEFKTATKQNAAQEQQPESCSLSVKRNAFTRLPTPAVERLHRVFCENRFPPRSVKEDIAKEFGMSFKQVHKWFDNARNSPRSPVGKKQVDIAVSRNSNDDCLHSHAKKEQVDSTVDRGFNNDCLDSHSKKEQAETTNDQESNKAIFADYIVQQERKESASGEKRRKATKTLSGKGKKMFRGHHGTK